MDRPLTGSYPALTVGLVLICRHGGRNPEADAGYKISWMLARFPVLIPRSLASVRHTSHHLKQKFQISCQCRDLRITLSASFVSLHAAMRLDDLVEVESHANLDVPCASWCLPNQFLKGHPHEELPIL